MLLMKPMPSEETVTLIFGVHKVTAPAGHTVEEYYEMYKDMLRLPQDVVAVSQ